jgi:hypothetical protein
MLDDIDDYLQGECRLFFGRWKEPMTAVVSVGPDELRLASTVTLEGDPREYVIVSIRNSGENGMHLRSFALEEGGTAVRRIEFAGQSWGKPNVEYTARMRNHQR